MPSHKDKRRAPSWERRHSFVVLDLANSKRLPATLLPSPIVRLRASRIYCQLNYYLVVVYRPYGAFMNNETRESKHIKMRPSIVRKAHQKAKKEGKMLGRWIEDAIEEKLEREKVGKEG